MGIQNAFKLLKDVTIISKAEPKNKIIIIDGSWLVYNTFLATKSVRTMSAPDGTPTGHLRIILNKFKKFHKNDNRLIVVWDSGTTDLKSEVKEERQARREEAQQRHAKAKEAGADIGILQRLEKLGVSPGPAFNSARKLIELFGVPQITADEKYEAEHVASELCQRGLADIVYTKDSDALFFGATAMGWHNKGKYHQIDLANALEFMKMDLPTFQKAGVMLGSDFAPKTRGVGPASVRDEGVVKDRELTAKQEEALALFKTRIPMEVNFTYETLENNSDMEGIKKYLGDLGFRKI